MSQELTIQGIPLAEFDRHFMDGPEVLVVRHKDGRHYAVQGEQMNKIITAMQADNSSEEKKTSKKGFFNLGKK